ncbi:MAG TPA: CRTAC1 family protein [Bryobacteraceae bacterium]|nr:CRTAC1 family protein [Bryobacteraceae bacterium]
MVRAFALFSVAVAFCILFAAARPEKIHFREVASERGLTARLHSGDPARRWIPEANGTGAAWLDYDNDGWMDLLIVNGADMSVFRQVADGRTPPPRAGGVFLYRNLGNGRFEDVTAKAGLANPYWGTGANAADYNNDGYTDLFITTIGLDLLYRNNGDGTFTEVGRQAGLSPKMAWHTGSAFGDYDGDGHLDLYIAGYVGFDALRWGAAPPVCQYRGVPGFCGPIGLKGAADMLYHNNGDGTFTEVTRQAGVADKSLYHGFTALFLDFNGDGKPDIFVANDSDPNYLYLNRGDGTFEEAALTSGLAFNGDGQAQSNMGVAVGDYDNDGLIDILTTTFSEDYFPLFRQSQPGFYQDVSARAGLSSVTLPWVGWACGFTDFDNDGWRDLWLSNGHVYPQADLLPTSSYRQPFVVLRNVAGRFTLAPGILDRPSKDTYRGGAACDFNNDGKMDLVVLPLEGPPVLLENDTQTPGNWIGLRLQGTRSNRDALGSIVRVQACGQTYVDALHNGGSYLSRDDPRLHFGLGDCPAVDRVTVRWPAGREQTFLRPPVNRYSTLREPAS